MCEPGNYILDFRALCCRAESVHKAESRAKHAGELQHTDAFQALAFGHVAWSLSQPHLATRHLDAGPACQGCGLRRGCGQPACRLQRASRWVWVRTSRVGSFAIHVSTVQGAQRLSNCGLVRSRSMASSSESHVLQRAFSAPYLTSKASCVRMSCSRLRAAS